MRIGLLALFVMISGLAQGQSCPICEGDFAILTADGMSGATPYEYTWNHTSDDNRTQVVLPTQTTVYTVTITDANGCFVTLDHEVVVENCDIYLVGDFVWEDLNRNGLQESGEPGISGVLVEAIQGGSVVASATTVSGGSYSLFLGPGTYQFRFTPSSPSYRATLPGVSGTMGSQINAVTDVTPPLNITGNNLNVDAGFFMNASVGNYVWNDINGNGLQDLSEQGISGVVVQLINASTDGVLASTSTASNGSYLFSNLPPLDYYLNFVLPQGFISTAQDQGSDFRDSDIDATGRTAVFSLISNEDNLTIDAGFVDCSPTAMDIAQVNNPIPDCVDSRFVYELTGEPAGSTITWSVTGGSIISTSGDEVEVQPEITFNGASDLEIEVSITFNNGACSGMASRTFCIPECDNAYAYLVRQGPEIVKHYISDELRYISETSICTPSPALDWNNLAFIRLNSSLLYLTEAGSSELYTMDASTCQANIQCDIGFEVLGLSGFNGNEFRAIREGTNDLYLINRVTCATTFVGTLPNVPGGGTWVAFSNTQTGDAYAISDNGHAASFDDSPFSATLLPIQATGVNATAAGFTVPGVPDQLIIFGPTNLSVYNVANPTTSGNIRALTPTVDRYGAALDRLDIIRVPSTDCGIAN